MGGYWTRHRLLPSIILVVVIAAVASVLFTFPVVEQRASIYNEQSIYKSSAIDFIAPEPSYEQVADLPGTEGISSAFPFYLTKTGVEINGKSRTTTVLLSDQFENMGITMYNEKRLIEKSDTLFDNPIFVDWKFCKDTSAKIGDTVSVSINGSKENFTIQAIYETNSIYDGGAILAKISEEQRNAIAENANSNGYSAIYVSASDYSKCKTYMTTDYRPLGRLRDRNQFESDEQYKVHYDAIMSSGYANEITDFRVRESDMKNQQSSLMIWLGAILTAALILAFNIVMAMRGCEKGYFTKHCIPKGIKVNGYYTISFIFEMVSIVVLYVGIFMMQMKLSSIYIPKSSIGITVAIIPGTVIAAEIVALCINNSKVAAITAVYKKNEEPRKKQQMKIGNK